MKTRYIIAIAAAALMLAGCQRESLAPDSGIQYDRIIRFAPSVGGIVTGVKSSVTEAAPAATRTQSLTLTSEDGTYTLPMSLSATSMEGGMATKATLINETGALKSLGDFAASIGNTFWVAAWDMPDDDDPLQCIPDDYALAEDEDGNPDKYGFVSGGYVSGDGENGYYQQVMYRTKDAGGEALATPYWMTVQPGSAAPADDEYKWKKNEAQKAFYAYANVPASATMAQLPDEGTLKQTLTLTELPDADILMGYYEGDGSTGEPEKQTGTAKIKFHHPFAAVKFETGTLASGVTITGVAIEKIYGKAGEGDAGKLMVTQEGHSFTWTRADGAAFKDANLLPEVSAACDGDAVLVIPQSLPSKARIRVTLQKGGETFNVYTSLSGSWSAGYVYTYTIGYNPPPEELLPGKFSINATQYVQFSHGNLFCIDNGAGTTPRYSFDFERNQYDFRTANASKAMAACIGGSYSTSGTPSGHYGMFRWSTDKNVYGLGSNYTSTTFVDWGTDPSLSGESWYTMSETEWNYLINSRTNASTKKGFATINNQITGLVLIPDNWIQPAGIEEFKPFDKAKPSYGDNKYSFEQWEKMEAAGAVFLPCAGLFASKSWTGWATEDTYPLKAGQYWTSTPNGSDAKALIISTTETGYIYLHKSAVDRGRAVRLVQKFHDYVDLDLPSGTLWATCNVGADSPEEYGDYFQWGGVTPVTSTSINVSWVTCPGNGGNENYNESAFNTWKSENLTGYVLKPTVDAARANWGGDWRMPTSDDFNELCENTYNQWIEENGVKGWKFTSKKDSGKHIFLPACGSRYDTQIYDKDSNGLYWSSSLNSSKPEEAYYLSFGSSTDILLAGRGGGCPVRPVQYVHD